MKKLAIYLAAFVALAACSHDEVDNYIAPMPESDEVQLLVNASMDEGQTRIASEDGLTFSFVENDAIGVYLNHTMYSATLNNIKFNAGEPVEGIVPFTKDPDDMTTFDKAITDLLKADDTKVLAYAPYSATEVKVEGSTENGGDEVSQMSTDAVSASRIFSLAATQNGSIEDVVKNYVLAAVPTAPKQVDGTNYKVDLRFSGIYALAKFEIVNPANTQPIKVSKIRLESEGAALTGLFTADLTADPKFASADYKLTGVNGKTNNYIEIVPDQAVEIAAQQSHVFYAVVNAATMPSATMIVETVGGEYSYAYTKESSSEHSFVRGTRKGLKLSLTNDIRTVISDETTTVITTAEELKAFAADVNGGNTYKGKKVVVSADIDLNNEEWTPIGTKDNPFLGTFDGQLYQIQNLYINNDQLEYAGLFGVVGGSENKATIKQINLLNVEITALSHVGAIAGSAYTGEVVKCSVTGDVKLASHYRTGGISGYGYATIKQCTVASTNTDSYIKATHKETNLEGDAVGGIVGQLCEQNTLTAALENCYVNIKNIEGSRKVGGIAGHVNQNVKIQQCQFVGNVTCNAPADYKKTDPASLAVGGILGENSGNNGSVVISNCIINQENYTSVITGKSIESTGAFYGRDRNASCPTTLESNNINNGATVIVKTDGIIYDALARKATVSNSAGLAWALKNKVSTIDLEEGEYELPTSFGGADQSYTINGATAAKAKSTAATAPATAPAAKINIAATAYGLTGSEMVFNNVHISCSGEKEPNGGGYGLQHSGAMTFNECYITNNYWCYSGANKTIFNYCTFEMGVAADGKQADYCLNTYGSNVDLLGCNFSCAGRAVHVYQNNGTFTTTVNATDCNFTASTEYKGYGAITVDPTYQDYKVVITNCKSTGFPVSTTTGTPLCHLKTNTGKLGEDLVLIIDGQTFIGTGTAEDLVKYLTEVGDTNAGNSKLFITNNIDLTGTDWEPVEIKGAAGADIITIEGQNHTITGLNAPLFSMGFAGGCGLVVNDLTVKNSTIGTEKQYSTNSDTFNSVFITYGDAMDLIEFNNCHLDNVNITGTGYVGGFVGWCAGYNNPNDGPVTSYVNLNGCTVKNSSFTSTDGSIGALIGHDACNPATVTTIANCIVTGCKFTHTSKTRTDKAGWAVGTVNTGVTTTFTGVSNTNSEGNGDANTYSGFNTETRTQSEHTTLDNMIGRFVPDSENGSTLIIDGTSLNSKTQISHIKKDGSHD